MNKINLKVTSSCYRAWNSIHGEKPSLSLIAVHREMTLWQVVWEAQGTNLGSTCSVRNLRHILAVYRRSNGVVDELNNMDRVSICLYIKLQHHQPEIAHRTWQLTLATTPAPFIPEDVLHLTKGRANSVVSFYYFRASLPSLKSHKQVHRKDTKMNRSQKESWKEYL